jgi:spectrin beta
MIETQMAVKAKQVNELENQAQHLQQMDPDKGEEIVAKKTVVESRFDKLKAPLEAR